jgi:5'-nucleotidase
VQILLTNDDGIQAPGLCALYPELCRLGDVQIVAPASEQSGVALSITYRHPLLVHEETRNGKPWGWAVAGSPADCVKLGVLQLCKETPRIIVSGINSGANVGINVLYSGTVAAAIEGAFFGITSIAVSQAYEDPPDYAIAARRAAAVIEQLLARKPKAGSLWNLNFPIQQPGWPRGLKVVPMGVTRHVEIMEKRMSPRGRTYFWSGFDPLQSHQMEPDTDVRDLAEGFITLTPLHIDMTNRQFVDDYSKQHWVLE